jgi:D-3-phosphoglycerate dehydrogenase
MAPDLRPTVVALGDVAPALVLGHLGDGVRFVAEPGGADLAEAQGAIVRAGIVVDDALLAAMPRLRVLARTGVGVDQVDLAAATRRGVAVVVTPGAGTAAVAEGAIGMALCLLKRFGPLTRLVRESRWPERESALVGDLEGATVGLVGYGRIGSRVGALAHAFGASVVAYDPFVGPPPELACADLYELAAASDVVSLHAPLTESTRHLVDGRFLEAAKAGAVLVNCARGALVDLDAVCAAVVAGRLGGVALDVFEAEPPDHHPLFDLPNVLLTPHVMGLSRRARAATFAAAACGVVDVLAGRRPEALANPYTPKPAQALAGPSDMEAGR